MRIISTFLPPEPSDLAEGKQTVTMLFDTLVGDKGLVVGITVGRVQGSDLNSVLVSSVGQVIVERMGRHCALNYPNGPVVVAGVAQAAGAKERVRQVLAKAPPQAAVLLVCANDKVYDAAFPALNVDYQSMRQHPQ